MQNTTWQKEKKYLGYKREIKKIKQSNRHNT